MLKGLKGNNAVLINKYITVFTVWTQLKLKYNKTSIFITNQYFTVLYNFSFNKDIKINKL